MKLKVSKQKLGVVHVAGKRFTKGVSKMTDIGTLELMIRENKKDGWKEKIEPVEEREELERKLDKIIEKYGPDLKSSFQTVLKINQGYGKNHETGSTLDIKWKGRLKYIWDILDRETERGREWA